MPMEYVVVIIEVSTSVCICMTGLASIQATTAEVAMKGRPVVTAL